MIREAWYVAAWSHELRRKPLGRKLLGAHVALFRDSRGEAHAVDAECPHRGVDLSAGRVVRDALQCPYHGWQFNASGRCIRIPSQGPDERIPPRARVRSYPLVEQQGVLWIWMADTPPDAQPTRQGFWDAARTTRICSAARLWPVSFVQAVEQSIDTTHTPFTHRGSIGSKQSQDDVESIVAVDDNRRGLVRRDQRLPEPGKGALHTFVLTKLLNVEQTARTFRYELGGTCSLRIDHAGGGFDVVVLLHTPADETRTWVFGETVGTHFRNPVSRYVHGRWFEKIMQEDTELGSSFLRSETGREVPSLSCDADHVTLAFRRLYRHWLAVEAEAAAT